jgi:hypothetical protein
MPKEKKRNAKIDRPRTKQFAPEGQGDATVGSGNGSALVTQPLSISLVRIDPDSMKGIRRRDQVRIVATKSTIVVTTVLGSRLGDVSKRDEVRVLRRRTKIGWIEDFGESPLMCLVEIP